MITLGERLKVARENKSLTQEQAAKIIGITNGAISGYERNYREPDATTLVKLSELYNVSVDWLLGITSTQLVLDYETSEVRMPTVEESVSEYNYSKKILENDIENLFYDNEYLNFRGKVLDQVTKDKILNAIDLIMKYQDISEELKKTIKGEFM